MAKMTKHFRKLSKWKYSYNLCGVTQGTFYSSYTTIANFSFMIQSLCFCEIEKVTKTYGSIWTDSDG